MLKIKAAIYRYFGIYLVQKERLIFLESKEAEQLVVAAFKSGLSFKDALGIVVGTWEAKNGLYRPLSPLRQKYRTIPIFIIYLHECYLACKRDILR